MAAKLIEVTGIIINPEFQRWDDVVCAKVDCNGPLRETNRLLWEAVEKMQSEDRGANGVGQGEGIADGVFSGTFFNEEPVAPPLLVDSIVTADGTEHQFRMGFGKPTPVASRRPAPMLSSPSPTSLSTLWNADSHITFKGPAEPGELEPQRTYRFYGRISPYTNPRTKQTETQFLFQTFCKVRGHGQAGTIRYLMDCPHVGKATADKLWAKFDGEAVRILRESPDVAVAALNLTHFTDAKAREASQYLVTQQAMESCTIDLIDLLGGRGFPKATAQAVVREWGNKAAELIRRDPYYLMQFRGCGFLKCDKMALALGMDPARMKRQALAGLFFLANDNEHTWTSAARVAKFIESKIGGTECDPMAAMKLAKRAGLLEVRKIENKDTGHVAVWVAETKKANQERYVCSRVVDLLNSPPSWPDIATLAGVEKLSDHQREALTRATRKSLGILRGDPGTGKSFTIGVFIRALESLFGASSIAVCAQAGAAADRFKKDLTESGSQVIPRTIHSTLGVDNGSEPINPDKRDTGGWSFKHNANNPFPYRFVFLDEGSMPGADLYAAFLAACGTGTMVLIIGDINQLPPISHGSVMRDLIAAGVPCGELTEPQRNAGTMILACQDIKHGLKFRTDREIDLTCVPPKNFRIIEAGNPRDQIAAMLRQLEWANKTMGFDPIWDCQVVVAVNAKSQLSRKNINAILQDKLNPNGKQVKGNPFRVGDKVACNDNGNYICVDKNADYADLKGKCRISNGTFGRVLEVEAKKVVVRFFHPDRDIVFSRTATYDADRAGRKIDQGRGDDGSTDDTDEMDGVQEDKTAATGCPLDLAYAGTCHMLQGSERKYVIPLLDEYSGAGRICRREWFFTAISRGKWLTEAIGKRATADAMCRTAALPDRKTFMREMLIEALWGDL